MTTDADNFNDDRSSDQVGQNSLSSKKPLTKAEQNQQDHSLRIGYYSRCIDDDGVAGDGCGAGATYADFEHTKSDADSDTLTYEGHRETLIGRGTGFIIATLIHFLARGRYRKRGSLNPLYRTIKTLDGVGKTLGGVIASLLPMSSHSQKFIGSILADVIGLAFALIALPYWLIREFYLKIEPGSTKYAKTGGDGWSKYGKTALVFGIAMGQSGGALHSLLNGSDLVASMALGSGIAGVAAFAAALILVPLVNKLCNGLLITNDENKDKFRNNYIRTGMTLFAGLGAILGFVLANTLIPGLAPLTAMALFGALSSVFGGIALGVVGEKISIGIHGRQDSNNSWDYTSRGMYYWIASLGVILGLFLPIPGGPLVGAALGAAIFGAIGWATGLVVARYASNETPNSITWTQRLATSTNVFSLIIGLGIGLLIGGLFGGPAGAVLGATLGMAIGTFVGGVIGILYDPKAPEIELESPHTSDSEPDSSSPNSNTRTHVPQLSPDLSTAPTLRPEDDDGETSSLLSSPSPQSSPQPSPTHHSPPHGVDTAAIQQTLRDLHQQENQHEKREQQPSHDSSGEHHGPPPQSSPRLSISVTAFTFIPSPPSIPPSPPSPLSPPPRYKSPSPRHQPAMTKDDAA